MLGENGWVVRNGGGSIDQRERSLEGGDSRFIDHEENYLQITQEKTNGLECEKERK